MAPTCPSENTEVTDQSSFWDSGNLNWDEHRIGWAIAGGCAALVSPCVVPQCSFSTGGNIFSDSAYFSRFGLATLSVSY